MVKNPVFWLWKAFFHPIFTLGYRIYRYLKKTIAAYIDENGRLLHIFTRRHVINVAILILTFVVTATNIQASSGSPKDEITGQRSLLARFTREMDDELLVEEAEEVTEMVSDLSYLDGQALNVQDYYAGGTNSAGPLTLEEAAELDELVEEDMVPLNAVRSQPESASQQELPPTRTSVVEYEVQEGDTVESIARKFGLQVPTVLQANKLGSRGLIRVGQKLVILPVDGILYRTKKGDSLSKLAKTYKSDAEKIAEFNSLADAGSLEVGMEIVLPGGSLPPPPPAPKPSYVYVPPASLDKLGSGELLWPTDSRRITQYFTRRHFGLDIGGPMRTPIYAADNGVVVYSGWNRGGYGNMIIIDHGGGTFTRYGHATKLLVSSGATVNRGDAIALMGSTGRSTGPHLHFEVLKGDIYHRVNPLDYIK